MSRIRLTTLALAAIAICSGVLTASLLVPPGDVAPIVVDNGATNGADGGAGSADRDTSAAPAGAATGGGTGTASAAVSFTVSDTPGRVLNLRPGSTQRQWVRLTNPNDVPIEVSSLSATVGQPVDRSGKPMARCSADAVTVTPLQTPVSVPAHGQTDTTLNVRMSPNTPKDCEGANYPLSYTGSGKPGLQSGRPGAPGATGTAASPPAGVPASPTSLPPSITPASPAPADPPPHR
ncbi:hypothetical protein [Gandjariella thermophila]|uniref:DUF4232 domain-containing protein n=1 Tax=Gandjariella thermophila TaxID=1931992 RepID=A0A4D4JCY2_9PSEU|nr:hypothetical protein [Gandjariella thermophila]GDY32256.1 hypothetical protein GTS_38890 [Gandjariella thermophila]